MTQDVGRGEGESIRRECWWGGYRYWWGCCPCQRRPCQPTLSAACVRRSSRSLKGGASRNILPGEPISSCTTNALWMSLSCDERRMWSSHLYRRKRILRTRFSAVVDGRASVWMVLPVICDSILLFAPLIICIVLMDKSHVSQPYVKIEHTAASYSRSLRFRVIQGEANT